MCIYHFVSKNVYIVILPFDSKHQCVEEYMKWIKLELLQVADGIKVIIK
jgi:hypothetical protein